MSWRRQARCSRCWRCWSRRGAGAGVWFSNPLASLGSVATAWLPGATAREHGTSLPTAFTAA